MSTPVVLAALLNLQTTLQAINGSAGGYFNTIKSGSVVLDPESLETAPATQMPFIVLDLEENAEMVYSGITKHPSIENKWTVPLRARVDAPGTSKSRKRTAAWQFYADVEKAVAVDPQRGQTVQYTFVRWPTFYMGLPNQNIVYIEIPIEFMVRRTYGAP